MANYEKLSSHVQKLASMNPEQLSEHLMQQNPQLSQVAPNLTPHLIGTASRAIQYLHQALPKPVVEFHGQEEYEPSKSQQEQWLERYKSVDDPISILDEVKHGTLTTQHLHALQEVHPDLYDHMKMEVMQNATPKAMKSLPYSTKLSVAKFLNQPMGASMVPASVAANQATYAAQPSIMPQQPPKRGKGSTLGGLSKLNGAKRAQTEVTQDESADD